MCRFERGEIYRLRDQEHTVFGTTTNGMVFSGHLVMGAGAALACRKFARDLDRVYLPEVFGKAIRTTGILHGRAYYYYLITVGRWAALQTKDHWKNRSDPALVQLGLQRVHEAAQGAPDRVFRFPLPGVGLGGLDPRLVRELCEEEVKEDNVVFHTL